MLVIDRMLSVAFPLMTVFQESDRIRLCGKFYRQKPAKESVKAGTSLCIVHKCAVPKLSSSSKLVAYISHISVNPTAVRTVWVTIAVVTLQTFYLGKHDLLTVYLGKLGFLSVTDCSLGNLPRGNFIVWVLDMSRKQQSFP